MGRLNKEPRPRKTRKRPWAEKGPTVFYHIGLTDLLDAGWLVIEHFREGPKKGTLLAREGVKTFLRWDGTTTDWEG